MLRSKLVQQLQQQQQHQQHRWILSSSSSSSSLATRRVWTSSPSFYRNNNLQRSFSSLTLSSSCIMTANGVTQKKTTPTGCQKKIPAAPLTLRNTSQWSAGWCCRSLSTVAGVLPGSLTGPAVCVLTPPGTCQFGEQPTAVPLLWRQAVSPTTAVLRFGLPDTNQPLNLSTCACILATATLPNGETVTRPYTPISTNAQKGSFDLLIKNYGPQGTMSKYLHSIPAGTLVQFKHIPFNVKIQAPFDHFDHILMLTGGTGVAPMVQALHAILGQNHRRSNAQSPEQKKVKSSSSSSRRQSSQQQQHPKVTMLYGSRTADDILGHELVDQWDAQYNNRQFVCHHVLSHEPQQSSSSWKGRRGYIDQALIAEHFPDPSTAKLQIFVCGPPAMYDALCGPRDQPDQVTGILGDMGYRPEQVYKF